MVKYYAQVIPFGIRQMDGKPHHIEVINGKSYELIESGDVKGNNPEAIRVRGNMIGALEGIAKIMELPQPIVWSVEI